MYPFIIYYWGKVTLSQAVGENHAMTPYYYATVRDRLQRHKNFTHCRVMNIMAINGISPPLAANSLTLSRLSLSPRAIGTHTRPPSRRTRRCPLIMDISRRLIVGFRGERNRQRGC